MYKLRSDGLALRLPEVYFLLGDLQQVHLAWPYLWA